MPCAFHLDRPERGCQFVVPDADLIEFNGKDWCVWHLPLGCGGAESPKSHWDDARIEAFNERVLDLVDQVKASDKPLNLWGVVFPGPVDFRRYAGEENALPGVWFDGGMFGGRALFSKCAFSGIASFDRTTFRDGAHFDKVTFGGLALLRCHILHPGFVRQSHVRGPGPLRSGKALPRCQVCPRSAPRCFVRRSDIRRRGQIR